LISDQDFFRLGDLARSVLIRGLSWIASPTVSSRTSCGQQCRPEWVWSLSLPLHPQKTFEFDASRMLATVLRDRPPYSPRMRIWHK
jgi:hypothetical protein